MLSFHSQPTGCVFRAPWVMLQHFTEPNYLDTLTKAQDLDIRLVLLYMLKSLFMQMVTLRRRVSWLNGFFSQIKKHKGSFGSFHFLTSGPRSYISFLLWFIDSCVFRVSACTYFFTGLGWNLSWTPNKHCRWFTSILLKVDARTKTKNLSFSLVNISASFLTL